MNTPESMKAVFAAWNNGDGIDLETWIGCEGNFSLAVGYASLSGPHSPSSKATFCRRGVSEDALRGFEQNGSSRKSVEWVMNHLHIADIQHGGCEDISKDKLVLLGNVLKEDRGQATLAISGSTMQR